MEWNRQLNEYCERTSADFWAEPLNAISNGAFIIAAGFALALLLNTQKTQKNTDSTQISSNDYFAVALIAILTLIGVGSFLFHTVATVWAALADVIPIGIFMLVYFFVATRRFLGASVVLSALATLCFAGLLAISPRLFGSIAGSTAGYVPALLAMMLFAVLTKWKRPETSNTLALAATIFAVSMIFRGSDGAMCQTIPIGTHYLWHILNAITLYVLIRGLLIFKT